jgi:hypothetical protein
MRIVTSETTDARIVWIVAFALRETIRLEPDIGNAWPRLHGDFGPGTVTLAAEVGHLLRRQILQAGQAGWDGGQVAVARHCSQVSVRGLMTTFALQTGCHSVQREFSACRRIRGVTTETAQLVVVTHQPSGGFAQAGRQRVAPPSARPYTLEPCELLCLPMRA